MATATSSRAKASMGYAGWVKIDNSNFIRATSCDIKVSQKIDKPEVVDGTIDRTVYQLGPKEIGGGLAFPAVFESVGGSSTMMSTLWDYALSRTSSGAFTKDGFPILVKYASNTIFEYTGCVVDSYEWSVTQSGTVDIKLNIIGIDRSEEGAILATDNAYSYYGTEPKDPAFPGVGSTPNTRIITWNDAIIEIDQVPDGDIRSFSCTVANNVKRYYALNQTLVPALLTPTKRDISGKISVMGRHGLSDSAATNENYCATNKSISFSLGGGASCKGSFGVSFIDICLFEYEEIAITNDLFETTVNYHVLPGRTLNNSTDIFPYQAKTP